MLRPKQKEMKELIFRDVKEQSIKMIEKAFDSSENIFEGIANLKQRIEEIKAYNMMKKAITRVIAKCEHDYSIILAFDQINTTKMIQLVRCKLCWNRTKRIIEV